MYYILLLLIILNHVLCAALVKDIHGASEQFFL